MRNEVGCLPRSGTPAEAGSANHAQMRSHVALTDSAHLLSHGVVALTVNTAREQLAGAAAATALGPGPVTG